MCMNRLRCALVFGDDGKRENVLKICQAARRKEKEPDFWWLKPFLLEFFYAIAGVDED